LAEIISNSLIGERLWYHARAEQCGSAAEGQLKANSGFSKTPPIRFSAIFSDSS
jgi:hypothetical protein